MGPSPVCSCRGQGVFTASALRLFRCAPWWFSKVGIAPNPGCVLRVACGCETDVRRQKVELWCACDGGRGGAHVGSVVSAVGDRGHTGGGGADGWRYRGELGPCRCSQCRAGKPVARKGKKTAAAISSAPTAWAAQRRGRPSSLLLPLMWCLASGGWAAVRRRNG